ncbi:hypothetical protein EVAR_28923_1 [Eumeta japonica]|uniref:Uncharacterized protein n=1 Tax=Eumeta variegata TaxID=151549 RepID=A0A4C1YPL2_EUMVA|nr:hypothetical protein EVAR_28923_1 [Eumeta japonica]
MCQQTTNRKPNGQMETGGYPLVSDIELRHCAPNSSYASKRNRDKTADGLASCRVPPGKYKTWPVVRDTQPRMVVELARKLVSPPAELTGECLRSSRKQPARAGPRRKANEPKTRERGRVKCARHVTSHYPQEGQNILNQKLVINCCRIMYGYGAAIDSIAIRLMSEVTAPGRARRVRAARGIIASFPRGIPPLTRGKWCFICWQVR